MQSLIDDCDFVGMSFYAPVSVRPTPDDFVRGIERYMNEFKEYGLSVPTTKPMQFSEVGIGGRRATGGCRRTREGGADAVGRHRESARQSLARSADAAAPPRVPRCAHSLSGRAAGPLAGIGGILLEHGLVGPSGPPRRRSSPTRKS